jgi:hypothetical protein
MAWLFNVNNANATWTVSLFDMIEDMITQGWLVLGSGDGLLAYENTGDTDGSTGSGSGGGYHVLTHSGSGANGMANQTLNVGSSWVRLRAPVDSLNPNLEYLWELSWRASMDFDSWRLMISIDGDGFDSGGDADTAPIAVDQVSLAGNQVKQGTTADFRVWVSDEATASNTHWVVGGVDEDYAFYIFITRYANNSIFGAWGLDPVTVLNPGAPGDPPDPDPHIHLACHHADATPNDNFWNVLVNWGMVEVDQNTTERVESMTGAEGPAAGCYAFWGKGKNPPDAATGLYTVALCQLYFGATGSFRRAISDMYPLDADGVVSYYSGNVYMRPNKDLTHAFWKGVSKGDLFMMTESSGFVVDDDVNSNSRLRRSGMSIPWPNGTAWVK